MQLQVLMLTGKASKHLLIYAPAGRQVLEALDAISGQQPVHGGSVIACAARCSPLQQRQWLHDYSAPETTPPSMGAVDLGYAALCDAPGTYVFQE